jgi:outer membrane biogenesis lipoprotein LolB
VKRLGPLAAACLLVLAGCRTMPTPVEMQPLPPDDPRPQRLVTEWIQGAAQRTALRGSARMAVDAEGERGQTLSLRVRQTLAIERPARLRIEVQSLLGTTLAVLAVDGREYALFETETRRFERGPLEAAPLWRIARLSLRPEDVIEALLGGPAADPGMQLRAAFSAPDGGVLVEVDDAALTRRKLLFDAEGRLRSLDVSAPELSTWRAAYDDYEPVDGQPFAHRVSIDTAEARAVLQLRDVELNPTLPADIFRLDGLAARAGAEGG